MTLTIQHDALSAEVAWLNKMFGTSPETAVIKVTTLLGAILLQRTDHDQWRTTTLQAQGIEQRTVCVDSAKLAAALKPLTGTITISIFDEQLVLEDAERTVKLRAATLDYPAWPVFESSDDRTAIGAIQVGRVLTSVGHDPALPQLQVVAFDKGQMVTTDRSRLTKVEYSEDGGFVGQVPFEAVKAFASTNGVVWVESGKVGTPGFAKDMWVKLSAGGRVVVSATADTTFPNWRQLIPADAPVAVAFRRDELFKAVAGEEMTLTVTPPSDYDDGYLSVSSATDGMEVVQRVGLEGVTRFDVDGSLSVTLKTKYVKECLKAIGSGLMLLTATASDRPVMFQDIAKNDLHLVMPVKQAV